MAAELSPGKERALKIFGGLAGSYDLVLDYATLMQDRRWKEWAVRHAGLKRGMKVLDIGCGTCVLEENLRDDCLLVGVDLSREMLAVGKSKRLPGVASLVRSDGERLPFGDASFDVVLSCYVVKYCDERVLVSEVARVLRPGGKLVLYDFVRPRGTLWPLNALYAYGGLRIVGSLLELSREPTAYTFSKLPRIIEQSSWEVTFRHTLELLGFSSIEDTLLSGGAAIGFLAVKETGD